ncbi:uncharacterized protein B0H64DRAFT_472779 [Chaetomium fimeti]|uniref:Protein disulfide-isomerase n=1 Tax=Chaetomium fimeti TaxID=1854472 RepID=A0AAE0LW76_9PEZI|nr:hypothetical protein B0H64DRAFT_472779 [Chaetomium fimeti]
MASNMMESPLSGHNSLTLTVLPASSLIPQSINMKFNLNHLAPFLLASNTLAWNHVAGSELAKRIANGQTLIAYVLPDEKGSQALEQEWMTIQETVGNTDVVSVDCSAEAELCDRDGVSSFPAIRLRQADGGHIRYRGPRKAASIQGFLRRTSRPAVSYVTDQNRTAVESIDDLVFVGQLISRDKTLQRQFETVAKIYRDRYSFAITKAHQVPELCCYNNLDGVHASTTVLNAPASFESFIKECAEPLIPQMTRQNELSFYQTRKSIVHYFVRSEKEREEYVTEMRPLANKYKEYLHFVTIDADEYADAAEILGIKRGSKGLTVQNPNNGDVFPYRRKEKVSAGAMEIFLMDIINGKIEAWRPGSGHDEL